MNWGKALLAGVAAGIVRNLVDWGLHGGIMRRTYEKYPIFSSEEGNPVWFFVVAIAIAVMAAILFTKTRAAWAEGVGGGARFGFYVGLVAFFMPFYSPLVIAGFPYFLAWCWGGIDLIGWVIAGAVLGAVIKR